MNKISERVARQFLDGMSFSYSGTQRYDEERVRFVRDSSDGIKLSLVRSVIARKVIDENNDPNIEISLRGYNTILTRARLNALITIFDPSLPLIHTVSGARAGLGPMDENSYYTLRAHFKDPEFVIRDELPMEFMELLDDIRLGRLNFEHIATIDHRYRINMVVVKYKIVCDKKLRSYFMNKLVEYYTKIYACIFLNSWTVDCKIDNYHYMTPLSINTRKGEISFLVGPWENKKNQTMEGFISPYDLLTRNYMNQH